MIGKCLESVSNERADFQMEMFCRAGILPPSYYEPLKGEQPLTQLNWR